MNERRDKRWQAVGKLRSAAIVSASIELRRNVDGNRFQMIQLGAKYTNDLTCAPLRGEMPRPPSRICGDRLIAGNEQQCQSDHYNLFVRELLRRGLLCASLGTPAPHACVLRAQPLSGRTADVCDQTRSYPIVLLQATPLYVFPASGLHIKAPSIP